ncbi:hypothetical protein DSL92_06715 [Billgrantia gudaonensis]|uniref:Uncharacterized protein n=1 Tax=Billgrantia gudaonensis TaxID=376427 RepID=A0A432JIJ9_9GAMM|nr:hypothetical protein DSL92_06715 [Halomonas gudaonensis]
MKNYRLFDDELFPSVPVAAGAVQPPMEPIDLANASCWKSSGNHAKGSLFPAGKRGSMPLASAIR